jgi:hypothetical protein
MPTQQITKTQYVANHSGTKYASHRLGAGPGTPLLLLIHFRDTMDKWDPLLINTLFANRPGILLAYHGVGQHREVATSIAQSASDNRLPFPHRRNRDRLARLQSRRLRRATHRPER